MSLLGLKLLERYILSKIISAFLLCLFSITALVWVTQALRRFDLVTAKGQTLWLFFSITGLIIPSLVSVVIPFALLAAIAYALATMNSENELVVISSAGGSQSAVVRPAILFTVFAMGLTALLTVQIVPAGQYAVRVLTTQIRADLISSLVKPGVFAKLEDGLTFHIRDRLPSGTMTGLFLQDERDGTAALVFLAQKGDIYETPQGTFLVMTDGVIHRQPANSEISIIAFDTYAFDLSEFSGTDAEVTYVKATERTTAELISMSDQTDLDPRTQDRVQKELHTRFATPLYAPAFCLIALAALARPVSTRASRFVLFMMVGGLAIVSRGIGLFLESFAPYFVGGATLFYVAPIVTAAVALYVMLAPYWNRNTSQVRSA